MNRILLNMADAVIADSEFLKKQLIERVGIDQKNSCDLLWGGYRVNCPGSTLNAQHSSSQNYSVPRPA